MGHPGELTPGMATSMRTRLVASCFTAAGLLLLLGLWLFLHNQTVNVSAPDGDRSTPAGEVGCDIAPYDAGLFGNDDPPGGEHPRDFAEEVATECYAANMARFKAGVGSGVLALVLLVGTAAAGARHQLAP